MKKYYAIGKTENVTYGHGSHGEETHITHINAYAGEMKFHPLFENRNDANDYIISLENNHNLFPVELELNTVKTKISDEKGNNLLADYKYTNLMYDATLKIFDDIHKKRNKVIANRLKEIVGVDLNIEEESKRRFKRLAMESNGNEETIYFNDGSIEGVRIVTFVRKESPLTFEIDRCEINVEYYFY